MNFCPSCGAKVTGANFCPNCGADLRKYMGNQSNSTTNNTGFNFSMLNDVVETENRRKKEIYDNFCKNAVVENGILTHYKGNEKEITIPVEIRNVKEGAFSACRDVEKIIVDDSHPTLTVIDGSLYTKDKKTLIKYTPGKLNAEFEVPNGVTRIADCAFSNSNNLRVVKLPESVTTVGKYAFYWCENLASVNLYTVETVEENAFNSCQKLYCVSFGTKSRVIGKTAFAGCRGLEDLYFVEGVTTIGESAFNGCTSLFKVTLPNSVKTLGQAAFYNCTRLKHFTLGNGLSKLENMTFNSCSSLYEINIPKSIKEIDSSVFHGCNSLRYVYIDELNSWMETKFFNERSNPLNYGDARLYIKNSGAIIANVVIPSHLKTVGLAFVGYKYLYNVTISEGITEISWNAFKNCSNLNEVIIPNSVTTIGDGAFEGCSSLCRIQLPANLKELMGTTFMGCTRLTSITIPQRVERIGMDVFRNSGVKTVFIPRGKKYSFATYFNGSIFEY